MPTAEVSRSDSNRSDASQRPRVSFNRDVHVKRIVPRENSRVSCAVTGIDGETVLTSPVRKERVKRSKKELTEEAAKVIRQADKVGCIANDKGLVPEKFYTLPNKKTATYPSNSLSRKRRGSLELEPPKKPPRTFASSPQNKSIFDFLSSKNDKPKKSNLRRSVSDATSLKSKAFGPQDRSSVRPESDEANFPKGNTKKQLSPIIEVSQREDYFQPVENQKHIESVTEQLKNYIDEVDEELFKETGLRITTPNKSPQPIIIDLDKAENISTNKKNKLNFSLGKKLKSLTQKRFKKNENEDKEESPVTVPGSQIILQERKEEIESQEAALTELEKSVVNSSANMIHSSQMPPEKLPLTKGKTVNSMVKRLSSDSCSSPPPTRTNVLITPSMSVQHNNNQPFSYTRGISPDKFRSNEDLQIITNNKPVIYAQVVCGQKNGKSNEKQTIHTTYNRKRQQHSDSDEGLGGEDSSGFLRKSFTHFGDDQLVESYQNETDKLIDEIDKYKAESPILPKYRPQNEFGSFMERGRGDGMDAKRRESLTEPDQFDGHHFSGFRNDLTARRDLLESRLHRRMNDKLTPSPEYYPSKVPRSNMYVSEKSSKYYRSGSTSPIGFKEKFVSETKLDPFGESRFESTSKKYFGETLDYPSSPEDRNRKLVKNKSIYQSTPEIYQRSHPVGRSYHDSLPRGEQNQFRGSSQKFRSEYHLNRQESDRRTDRLVDSGIENDFRRDSSENYHPSSGSRPIRARPDIYNESEDEGFASSLLITNEKHHNENNQLRKSRKDYDSDLNSKEEFYRSKNKYIPRERSIDDGSHFDPRLDSKVFDRKIVEKKPPKPEKKSGLEKVKSLFSRQKEKSKINKTCSNDQRVSTNNYRNRRRLSTPSPPRQTRKRPESIHSSWFKSLDRLTKRKSEKRHKDGNFTSTEDEAPRNSSRISSSTNNLRFFGDTDQESNGDSVRGVIKKRSGLRSQSSKDLNKIPEEKRNIQQHQHKSLTNISQVGNKPPISPISRYPNHLRDDRRRHKKPEVSSVESSTEGDSSQQSQRSIVYLHAATVGDIPLRSSRAASREDLTSNGSSFIQPQVKTLSRSFSVLAPWRPRHQREAMDIDYTQYNKKNGKYEQKTSRTSSRNDSSTLKRRAQENRKGYQQSPNRPSRSKENLSALKESKEASLRGSTSTLYKKKDKLPRENSRYIRDKEERKLCGKSQSVESIARRRENRDVSRSVSMPRDSEKTAGWFKRYKKGHRL